MVKRKRWPWFKLLLFYFPLYWLFNDCPAPYAVGLAFGLGVIFGCTEDF